MNCYLSLFAFLCLGLATAPVSSFAQTIPCGTNAPIFDNSCTASSNFTISVNGTSGTQLGTDVILQEVRIIVSHTWDNDLDIILKSPHGVSIELSTDNGGGADHYGDPSDNMCTNYTSFTMNACTPIENGVAPFIGNYIPEGNFTDFNDGSDPDGTWVLQICDDAANDAGYLYFAELVFAEMSCPPPTMLYVDTLLDDGASMTWVVGSTCVNTLLEYGPVGFLPGTGAAPNEGTLLTLPCPVAPPYTISGLDDLTTYDIYIREACSNGGYSDNSCPLTITTNCNTAPATLLENFNTLAACSTTCGDICPITGTWFNSSADDFDWLIDGGGTGSANTGPSDDISGGGQYIYTEASGSPCRNGNKAILESNCLLVDASVGSCHLSFYHHLFGNHINELKLEISTNGGSTWTPLWNLIGNQGDVWERTYIDLSAYHGLLAKFRFVAIGGNGIQGDMALDEIAFFGTTLANSGGTTFYADQDNDSFGDLNNSITICTQFVPSGYVTNANDCDDSTASISPNAIEIPCNNIDENCDGFLLQTLPLPITNNQIICTGTTASLSVNGIATGDYYWSDEDGNILFVGDTFQTPVLTDTTYYWVQDSVINICTSPRKMVTVSVDPGPMIGTNDQPTICLGDAFDLSGLNIIDANNNVATITYHSASPAGFGNELTSSIVAPNADTTFVLQAATINGCTAELPVFIKVNNTPTAIATALNNDLNICANELTTIHAAEGGTGTGQITYLWEDGSTAPDRTIFPSNPPAPFIYILEVTDDNGCTDVDSIVINTLPSITGVGIESISAVSFCNGNDGAITLNPVNGQGPYNYDWSGPVPGNGTNASGSFTLNGLTQGAYKVTISDASGENCQVFIPNMIVNGPGVVVDTVVTIMPVTCFGESNGSIDINISGGTADFTWSNGFITEDLQNVPAGNYSVTIADGNCETILTDLEIPSPTLHQTVIATVEHVSCANGTDGAIDINTSGGIGPYDYSWSNNEFTEDLANLPAGNYQVTILDANNCAIVGPSVDIVAPAPLVSNLESITEVSCYGGSDGAVAYSVSGGTAPYFYEWSNGLLTNTISNLPTGTYQPTITDANGCFIIGMEVEVISPDPLAITLDLLKAPDCNEISNGAINVTVSGGTAPYTYSWNHGFGTDDISDLPEGEYTLLVTDNRGCTVISETYELTAPEVLFFGFVFINEESCNGVGDGAINMQVVGGTEPYTYLWNTGQQTDDIENLSAGTYQLLVSDNNGCTTISPPLEVSALTPLAASVATFSDISCAGQADGSIYLDVPNAGMPYTYLWNNGSTNSFLDGVPSGAYQARITANDGCIFYTDEIIIEEPDTLTAHVVSVESPTCNGFFNGSIDVAVSGGMAPYSFSWNDGTHEEDMTGVPSGTYLLTVLDQNGCVTSTEEVQLMEPTLMQLNTQSTGVGCIDSIGNLTATITGGTAPYTYLWNTGDDTNMLENLPAGQYSLTATDANGCILLNSGLVVNQLADTLAVHVVEDSEVSCYGVSDASLSVDLMGGNYPFQYNWSNGVTDSLNQNLSGGNYKVTVTDNYGCIGISEILTVASPSPINYFVNSIVGNLCLGDQEGSIALDISGGLPPYDVNWSNGADSSYIDQLGTGSYYLTITDQHGCTITSNQPIAITGPGSSVQGQIVGSDHINCFGDMDAAISVIPSGGTGGYDLAWSTGSDQPTLENLGSGFYQCTITDQNNCIFVTTNYEITGPSQALTILLDSTQIWNNEDCDGMEGAIDLVVTGGTSPYNYLWSNNAITSAINNLPSGSYSCTVSDDNGCITSTGPFLIEEPENTLVVNNMTSTPDTNGMSDGTAAPEVSGGSWPYSFAWDEETGFQTDSVAVGLSAGIYNITITDAHECMVLGSVLVDTITILSDAVVLLEDLGTLNYFPNPTTDVLYVNLELAKAADVVLRLVTVLGQPVLEWRQEDVLVGNFVFDLTLLVAGTYVLWGEVGGRVVVREVLVVL